MKLSQENIHLTEVVASLCVICHVVVRLPCTCVRADVQREVLACGISPGFWYDYN